MKITVPLKVFNERYAADVTGEILDMPNDIAMVATFIVHKNPWVGGYQVSHAESGLRVGEASCRTKKSAVADFRHRMQTVTPKEILAKQKFWGIK